MDMSMWNRFNQLFEPSSTLTNLDERRQSRLLAMMLVFLAVIGGLTAAITPYYSNRPHLESPEFYITVLATGLFLIMYGVNQKGYFRWAARFIVFMIAAITFMIAYPETGELADLEMLHYLVLPVLISSVFLSVRTTVLLLVACNAAMLAGPAIVPGVIIKGVPVVFLTTMTIIIILADKHRQNLEQDRQAEIMAKERQLRAITDNASDVIVQFDADNLIRYVSPSSKKVLGYPPEIFINNKGLSNSTRYHPDDVEIVRQTLGQTMQDGNPTSAEYRYKHADGHYVWLETTAQGLFDENGSLTGAVFVSRDVTARKMLADQRLKAKQLSIEVEAEKRMIEMRENFLSTISHDLRTPISIIFSSKELLERYYDRLPDEKRQTHFNNITQQCRHMTDMLDELLHMRKSMSGKEQFMPGWVDIDTFCEDITDKINLSNGNDKRIVFTCASSHDNSHDHQAYVDERLLRHILSNLLTNAPKYSTEGQLVTFELKHTQTEVQFRIADRGIGIPDDELAELYEPFHRAANVGKINGTGLGMFIVKKNVDLHGGTIDVETHVGQGTTFTVTLPVVCPNTTPNEVETGEV